MLPTFSIVRESTIASPLMRTCPAGLPAALLILLLAITAWPVYAPVPLPPDRVDISRLGYTRLSESARLSCSSNVTLDFVDQNHILLTFNPKKLITRLPNCPASHEDRLIHAVIVESPSGKIIRETDWYLHDSRRYLWKLGNGRCLA